MTDKNLISNYKYIKTIGEGTFGKVKLAIHIITGEKVAIKILQKNLIRDQNEYERIEREIKYLKLFSHPNIIQIYEVIENITSFYIVMEYAQGGELFNYIVEKEKLSEKESSFYFYQIIQGVKEIHSKNICHRDIKPENLLFTKNKILKIIDFGLSSEYENFLSTPCGSPCYASPEMIKGKKYNGLSIDLWACGVILFAMLCGYLPFDDKDNNALFKKIVECNIDYPEEDEVELSENSLDLINKILTPNPKKRIGLEDILNHPFMKYGKKAYNNIINKPENFSQGQEELIINYMVTQLGFDNKNNKIETLLHSNKHNNITTTYYLLKKKYMDGRLNLNQTIIRAISEDTCNNILNNKKNNSIDVSLDSSSLNNNSNYINYSKKRIQYIKKNLKIESGRKKYNNITINNLSYRKRSKTTSCSQSKKNILSIKNMIKKKDSDRNNIIIINNTNMIQQPEKIKSIYNNIFLNKGNAQQNFYRKIETSVSLDKSTTNTKNNLTNIIDNNKSTETTYNNNNKTNEKEQIKVCLKKGDRSSNPILYYNKKFKENELLIKKRFIYLPGHNYSNKPKNRKTQPKSYQNDFLTYKKNTSNISGINKTNNNNNNLYSFDGNTSNNFNTSVQNNYLNALSYDTNNYTLNVSKKTEFDNISTSRERKTNIKNIFMNDDFNNKYKNRFLYRNKEQNISNTLEINKENSEILNKSGVKMKNILDKNKINYVKNIEKICKRIFRQNNRNNINYLNSNQKSYDYKNNEMKINENYKNRMTLKSNRELSNNIRKEYFFQPINKQSKLNESANNVSNSVSNKIIVKNCLTKNNPNIQRRSNQIQTENQTTIENSKLKNKIQNNANINITNNINNIFYRKLNCESYNENNKNIHQNQNLINRKISNLKTFSPCDNNNNKTHLKSNNNIMNFDNVSTIIKKNKINKNIKEILSLKTSIKDNKEKLETKSNIYNLLQNEKENIQIESSTRNNYNNSNNNYMPITAITTRDKHLFVSRNQYLDFNSNININNNTTKSNSILIEKNKIMQSKVLSTEREINNKNNKLNEWSSLKKEGENNIRINKMNNNNMNSKKIKINKKKLSGDKFLVTNTEMTIIQLYEKIQNFCRENNLIFKNIGNNNCIISEKNFNNYFMIELVESSFSNVVKFFHEKNTGKRIKDISTKLFVDIANS